MINDINEFTIDEVAIAALLHDTGKFMQRAFISESYLSETTKKMEDYICPPGKYGRRTHRHSLWTYEFFERKILRIPAGMDYNRIQRVASFHHNPEDDFFQKVIQKSDMLSSGFDRIPEDEEKSDAKFFEKPIVSIFSEISIFGEKEKKYHNLCPLGYNGEILPVSDKSMKLSPKDYKSLWDQFIEEIRLINTDNIRVFMGALLYLLKKYTWCIPSSTYKSMPDIPLYDHMLTTSSIASSLYRFHLERDETRDMSVLKNDRERKFLLISGDLSGIQKFIFDLKQEGSKGVSKILRGRSFYLGQMTSAAVHYLLDSLDIPLTSKIMDAGGRFTLLVPNTERTLKIIGECRNIIEKYCLETFSGELSLNIDNGVSLSQQDFKVSNYSNIVAKLTALEMEKKKKAPLINALRDSSFVMEKNYDLFEKGACNICGKEPILEVNDGKNLGNLCEYAQKLGKELPHSDYIIFEKVNRDIKSTDFWGKYRLKLCSDKPKKHENLVYAEKICDNSRLNNAGHSPNKMEIFPTAEISNYVPQYGEMEAYVEDDGTRHYEGDIKTFADIAKKSDGVDLLGILKSDLDNMGYIFRGGFPENTVSISRIVSLSRSVNFFFTTYLAGFLAEKYPDTYTLFAGGDDLCLIGPWNKMIDLARDIHKEFHEYTGKNDDITISSGLHFIKPNYPAGKAISHSEDVLEISKEKGKDCLTMFNYSVKWGEELNTYLALRDSIRNEINKGESPIKSSTLYRFIEYHREYRKMIFEHDHRGALWISHMKYDIARNIKEHRVIKKDPERRKEVDGFLFKMMETHSDKLKVIEKLPVALFPVILAGRKKSKSQEV